MTTSDMFREHLVRSGDGLMLYARDYGPINAHPPLVCLAGLTRNSRDFHHFALALSSEATQPRRVITIDTRGRGRSQWDEDKSRYSVPVEAGDVLTVCAALGIEHADFMGTSRGGLIMHVLAAVRPDIMRSAILNDVGPAIGTGGLALIQSYLRQRSVFANLDQVAVALKLVHGEAFPTLGSDDWRDFAEATYVKSAGGYEPDHDPAIAEAMAGLDLTQPLPELWDQFQVLATKPLMTIRGENSLLLTPEILETMKRKAASMKVIDVAGQGHAPILHLAGLPEKIAAFLRT